jgi:hypothetical protein
MLLGHFVVVEEGDWNRLIHELGHVVDDEDIAGGILPRRTSTRQSMTL